MPKKSPPLAPRPKGPTAIDRMAADLKRQYAHNDVTCREVTFEAERHNGTWGIRVEYLWDDPKDDSTRTGSWMNYHSGVTTEAAAHAVANLLNGD